MSEAAARQELAKDPELAAVLNAVASGDADELLSLAVSAGDDFCSLYSDLPPDCDSKDQKLPSVFQDSGEVGPRLVKTMKVWLSELLSDGAMLEFATRDSRFGTDKGAKYYLYFRVPRPVTLTGDDWKTDSLALAITTGQGHPIEWFAFERPDFNGLKWVQFLGGDDGARYHVLITPESADDIPGLFNNEKGD